MIQFAFSARYRRGPIAGMFKKLFTLMFFVTIGFIFVTSAMSRNGDDLGHLAGPIAIIMVAVLFIVGAIYSARKSGVMYSRTTSSAGLFGLFRTRGSATRVVTRNANPFEYWIWLGVGIVFCTAMIALGFWLLTKHTRGSHRTAVVPPGSLNESLDEPHPEALFSSWDTEPPDRQYGLIPPAVDLRDKPANLVTLASQPESLEPDLKQGRWLVLFFSVLSSDSVNAAINSPDLARRLTGHAQVAIRPTKAFEGTEKWLPDFQRESLKGHPFWIVFDDGIAIRRYEGWMDNEEAAQFARQ